MNATRKRSCAGPARQQWCLRKLDATNKTHGVAKSIALGLIDFLSSALFLLSFPIHLFTQKNPFSFFRNCVQVLLAKKTWIGYNKPEKNLPPLRKGVLASNGVPLSIKQKIPPENLQTLDEWYARDYEQANDIKILLKEYRRLGD